MVVYPNHALAQEHAVPLSLPVGFGLCTEVRNEVGCKEEQVWFILKLFFNYQSYGKLESATCVVKLALGSYSLGPVLRI